MIDRYFAFIKENGYFERKRQEQARYWMYETINEQLRNHFYNNEDVDALLIDKERRVLGNQQSSFTAARDVLDFYFKKLSEK
jgi:LAO/AO transport system kinase